MADLSIPAVVERDRQPARVSRPACKSSARVLPGRRRRPVRHGRSGSCARAAIKDENGKLMFEQKDGEIPAAWTQLATNVVVSKYFYGENGTPERERSVRQLIHRVTRTIADWGMADGYFASAEDGEQFYRELTWLCLHQHGAFNSPVWFNVGLYHQYGVSGRQVQLALEPRDEDVEQPENPYEYPQGSACFIQSVDDNMEAIMRLATQRGHALQVRQRHGHRPFDAPLASRKALRRRQAHRPALVHAGL